jgi:hypothetical protein
LAEIKKLRHNYERSQEMYKTIQTAGFADSAADVSNIISQLLAIGEEISVTEEVQSQLAGPVGRLQVTSVWKETDDGMKYLATLKLMPVRG